MRTISSTFDLDVSNADKEKRTKVTIITLYTLTSLCIFSILFSIHFLGSNKENL